MSDWIVLEFATVYPRYTVGNNLTILIMLHSVRRLAALCGLQHFNLRRNKDFNGKQVKSA